MPDAFRIGALEVLAPAARTTDQTVDVDISTSRFRGIVLVTDLTAFTTAASLTMSIRGRDPVSGKTWPILTSAAIAAVATNVLRVGPDLAAAANLVAVDLVPPNLQIFADHGNANSHTYSVSLIVCP